MIPYFKSLYSLLNTCLSFYQTNPFRIALEFENIGVRVQENQYLNFLTDILNKFEIQNLQKGLSITSLEFEKLGKVLTVNEKLEFDEMQSNGFDCVKSLAKLALSFGITMRD